MLGVGADRRQRRLAEVSPEDVVMADDADRSWHLHVAPTQPLQDADRQKVVERDQRGRAAAKSHVSGGGSLVERRHERAKPDDVHPQAR